MDNRMRLLPTLLTDKNGVKRIYYLNPDDETSSREVEYDSHYPDSVYRAEPKKIADNIHYYYDPANKPRLYVADDEGHDGIDFSPEDLDGLSDAIKRKDDGDIRSGEIYQRGYLSIWLKDGWDYTPEDDEIVIKDSRKNHKIRIKWRDIRKLAIKNDILLMALTRSNKKIPAGKLMGGDIVDLLPDLQAAYNNLAPDQLDSEQADMLQDLISECQDNMFLIEDVQTFNDHVTVYNGEGKSFDLDIGKEIQVESHEVSFNPLWGEAT